MNIDQLKEKAKKDLAIDTSNLDVCSVRIPYVSGEWMNFLNDEIISLKKLEFDYDKQFRLKWKFYKTEFNMVLKDKNEVMIFINGDEDIIELKMKIVKKKEKVKFIESTINTLNQMSFNISNAIKFLMFKSGTL